MMNPRDEWSCVAGRRSAQAQYTRLGGRCNGGMLFGNSQVAGSCAAEWRRLRTAAHARRAAARRGDGAGFAPPPYASDATGPSEPSGGAVMGRAPSVAESRGEAAVAAPPPKC
jgi:hypothetical protein